MKRARIPLWQSLLISVATAAAAVAIYEAAFVSEPVPAVIVQRVVEPAVCPEPRITIQNACPHDEEDDDRDALPADSSARQRFEYAIDLLRNKEVDAGCRELERVAVMQEEPWRGKAQGLIERRCTDREHD